MCLIAVLTELHLVRNIFRSLSGRSKDSEQLDPHYIKTSEHSRVPVINFEETWKL